MRETITFRPVTQDDTPFLRELYASTRAEELALVPWTAEEKRQFLDQQFEAQTLDYTTNYDVDDFHVIEQNGAPIGRLYLDRSPEDICIVDIALVPQVRGQGIGTLLLREILDEARQSGRTVSIYVEHFNPARHLYDRLGFRHVDTNGVYHRMLWTPDQVNTASYSVPSSS
jgi:ribosomal protein S18 acetylase RimI-like enzyme